MRPSARAAGALAAALLSIALFLPESLLRWWLTEDATEHLAIAHAFVQGAGFVDPVQWAFTLPVGVPLPAHAVRPPLLPLLLAAPLALGASVATLMALHALFASAVAAALVLVACRFMSPAAAAGAALLLVAAPGWRAPALHPWTEVTGAACLLAVLAAARGVPRSVRGAGACAAVTALAWLARPNLGALALAVAAAAALELGPRRALRSVPLWGYLGGFAALLVALQGIARAGTGFGFYQGYTGEMLAYDEIWSYGKRYVGTLAYLQANSGAVLATVAQRAAQLARALCLRTDFHGVGWLIPFGVAHALLAPRRGALERRFCALACLGLSLVVMLNYAPYEPRYALFPALTGWLCVLAMLDDAARGLAVRLAPGRTWPRRLPLLAPLALIALTTGPASVERASAAWGELLAGDTRWAAPGPFAALCAAMDRDAVVAASRPWPVQLWCGNAALILPHDLAEPELRARFLADKQPRYLLAKGEPHYAWLAGDPSLRELARSGSFVLYERADGPPPAPPWRAPPPLACAGRAPDCVVAGASP